MTNSAQLHGINFRPMLKRFMVWGKEENGFLTIRDAYPELQLSRETSERVVFSVQELVALFSETLYYDDCDDYTLCQSTGLFDKDGEEIFEGSIIALGFGIGKVKEPQFNEIDSRPQGMPLSIIEYNETTASFQYRWGDRTCRVKKSTASSSFVVVGHILSDPDMIKRRAR